MIAILMGGYSAEREVSLRSGQNVYQSLCNKGVDCFLFDWTKDASGQDNLANLWQQSFDFALIVLHGKGGEDGVIQQSLEQKGIAFSGSNSQASKLCLNKQQTKNCWLKHGLPTAKFVISNKNKPCPEIDFPLPWIVKPNTEGSSIGISKVSDKLQLQSALDLAHQYDDCIIIEQYIKGREYTVGVFASNPDDLIALPIIEIEHQLDFLDYNSKYFDTQHQTHHHCPAPLSIEMTQNLQQLAIEAFTVLGGQNWGRVDIMVEGNQPFLLEVNTAPGMTPASLIPIAIKAQGIDMADFILCLKKNKDTR